MLACPGVHGVPSEEWLDLETNSFTGTISHLFVPSMGSMHVIENRFAGSCLSLGVEAQALHCPPKKDYRGHFIRGG